MKPKESAIELVQVGAPHGVLDLGNTLRLYQNVVRAEFAAGTKNVLLYENAGAHTRAEAERLTLDIARRGSVVDAAPMAGVPSNRAVDERALQLLTAAPTAEHGHNLFSQFFLDWLLKASSVPISVFPESSASEAQKQSILRRALEGIAVFSVENNSLDGLITSILERGAKIKTVVDERDLEIASFLEQKALALASAHTRVKILVMIGSEHPGIRPAMSEAFMDRADYKIRNFGPPVEGPEIDEEFAKDSFSRESAARLLCAKIISNQMKMMFLAQYQATLLKEPARDGQGQTVFDHTMEICQTAPLEAVHMFLQRVARIDCGLPEDRYAAVLPPPLLTPDLPALQGRLRDLVTLWGVNDLSGSEVGVFLDRTFVLKFFAYGFATSDMQHLSGLLKKLVAELPTDVIQELKMEMEAYLRSGGATPIQQINPVLAKILYEQKFLALREDLVRRKIIINVGGYAQLKLRIWA